MFDVPGYWEKRYLAGGDSGAGSRAEAAVRKAAYVNNLITTLGVHSVIDWGCGDGEVAQHLTVERYVGLDVSPLAVDLCWQRAQRPGWSFLQFDGVTPPPLPPADLALSLDVIYHLVEDDLYRRYLALLFASAPLVCVHSTNYEQAGRAHVLHRRFTADLPAGFEILAWPERDDTVGMWVFRRQA